MELDSRIKVMPYNCLTCNAVVPYIGKMGLLCDDLSEFTDINTPHTGVLKKIDPNREDCFVEADSISWRFFVPLVSIEKTEKYRPYRDVAEFNNRFLIGHAITFRRKSDNREYCVLYLGYAGTKLINLGGLWITLDDLFNEYEYDGKPFGARI
jgi:hypothetical protein